MKIIVKLFATLRENRGKMIEMNVSENVTVKNVLDELNIQKKDIAILLVNGRDSDEDKNLFENDTISIFPPVGGG